MYFFRIFKIYFKNVFFTNTLREENMSDTLPHSGHEENNDKVAWRSNSPHI